MMLDRGSHVIHYEVHEPEGPGERPTLLLVMGMAFSSRAWDALPAALASRYRVITFDNRGTGRSTLPRDARGDAWFRIRDLADDAVAVLDHVAGPHAKAHVFGISLGGMIATELALAHRHRVDRLVLGATFAGWLRSAKPALPILATLVGSSLFARHAAEHVAPVLVSKGTDLAKLADWLAKVERAPPPVVLRQMLAAVRHAAEDRLAQLDVPTLVITGDADALIPPANSRKLARLIPGARLVELPGAGHCFPFEQLDATVDAVNAFLLEAHVPRAASNAA